jgi:uncharacterized protein (DUF2147 family)
VYKKLSLCIFGLVIYLPFSYASSSPVGRWTTIDDKTGEKKADIELSLNHGVLYGTIVRRYMKPGDPERCIDCPGRFKDQPIQGLRFIWGLKEQKDGSWAGGKLIDPKTGKIYHLKMVVEKEQLHVRGYIGVPLLGRTQVWVPAKG